MRLVMRVENAGLADENAVQTILFNGERLVPDENMKRQDGTIDIIGFHFPELVDNIPDGAFLEALAKNYNGNYHASYSTPTINQNAQREIPITHTLELSRSPILGILFCMFSGIGWILRRRGGGR